MVTADEVEQALSEIILDGMTVAEHSELVPLLRAVVETLRRYERADAALNQALNEGDGSYKP